jgi:hypothetical protein
MSPIDYSVLALPKGKPAQMVRHEKRVSARLQLAEAYVEVDRRDKKRCRVTGKPLTPGAVDEWRRLERDHLAPRSTHPELVYDVDNILTVAAAVHGFLHCGALIPVDAKGEETTRVSLIAGYRWTRKERPPFRIVREKKHKLS